MKYDMIIIGGGPAGVTAAIYALRANKRVLLLEKETIGGKIAAAALVENYPGIEAIKGSELANKLQEQVTKLGAEIKAEEVIEIKEEKENKVVKTKQNEYKGKSIIIATGTKYKKLGLEKEEELIGKGISFCATCDGFFFKNKTVAVIGGGNTAISNALELANICKKVYLIQVLDHLTAEAILQKQIQEKENIEIIKEATVTKYLGEEKLIGIEVEKKNQKQTIMLEGIFLSIGQIPETMRNGKKRSNRFFWIY